MVVDVEASDDVNLPTQSAALSDSAFKMISTVSGVDHIDVEFAKSRKSDWPTQPCH